MVACNIVLSSFSERCRLLVLALHGHSLLNCYARCRVTEVIHVLLYCNHGFLLIFGLLSYRDEYLNLFRRGVGDARRIDGQRHRADVLRETNVWGSCADDVDAIRDGLNQCIRSNGNSGGCDAPLSASTGDCADSARLSPSGTIQARFRSPSRSSSRQACIAPLDVPQLRSARRFYEARGLIWRNEFVARKQRAV